MRTPRVNWHSAAADAIQITLRDYDNLLEYRREYSLSRGAHRIDLLVIHKLLDVPIPHPIARQFAAYNLFEIKGISSSVTVTAYYKTIAYAALLIAENAASPPHFRRDISLTFVSHRFPRKLIRYLTEECQKKVANPFPGIYNVSEDIFPVQILVTQELPPDTALYLRCLTNKLQAKELIDRLALDYTQHQNELLYENYMDQLINANLSQEGGSAMCCEGIFKLYGTSSKEIAAKAAREAVAPVLEELDRTSSELDRASHELSDVKRQNSYLRQLLEQHGIAYNC